MFKHLLCLLACALLLGEATAVVKEPIMILDHFTLGRTDLTKYIADKRKVCTVPEPSGYYSLPASCYQSDALISANIAVSGNSAKLYFNPKALPEVRKILLKNYGEPDFVDGSGLMVWKSPQHHILLTPGLVNSHKNLEIHYAEVR